MRFVHLSDLHIGKRVNGYSMLEDQKYILDEILKIIASEKPDAVFISGDLYDKSIPPAEAVTVFDEFLVNLSKMNLEVFVISGNHDSPERIAFGSRLMNESGIHISPVYEGEREPFILEDEYGEVFVYMLPFVKPSHVQKIYQEEEIKSYTDALKCAIDNMNVDFDARNIILTHQFVTGAERSDSEEISVGGSDNVDAWVFEGFDYTALGHIHRPQNIGSERIRYCGTPLKYSLSEANHVKSVTVGELKEKGSLEIKEIPLKPLRDMRVIKGKYDELTLKSFYEKFSYKEDYIYVILTDEEVVPDAIGKLRLIYKNLMKLEYDNRRGVDSFVIDASIDAESKSPFELFADFFELRNKRELSEEQSKYLEGLIEKIWRDEE